MLTHDDLLKPFLDGCKPPDKHVIGLEHEQFAFNALTCQPLPYDGEPGIRKFLDEIARRYDWTPKYEEDNVIALSREGHSLTLEPAGQVELSGTAYRTIKDVVAEHQNYLTEIKSVGDDLGIDFCSMGFHPEWRQDDMPWMPKQRYEIMGRYLPTKGGHALDMMRRTCGSQINLDYADEADMVTKYRVSQALQPVLTALFANSWKVEGKDTGYTSYRSYCWMDTDPDRCGVLPFVFDNDMRFERYVQYALDVPMFFIEREGKMIDMTPITFRQFMDGQRPDDAKDHAPTSKDWADHLTTLFPEVRLKSFLEMRGTDSVPPPLLYAIASFWVGLLYDSDALGQCLDVIKDWSIDDHLAFRAQVPEKGLQTPVPNTNLTIRDFAPQVIEIAEDGLDNQPGQQSGLPYLDDLRRRLYDGHMKISCCG